MDRYQRVEKPRPDTPINENEIRITTQGKMRNYITYATTLLQKDKGSAEIIIKAMGRAINKTVTIAEIIKRRIAGLHQITSIGSIDITDSWEPLEEGLLPLETTRHVSMITITLSTKELDTNSPGYQPPLPADQVKPLTDFDYDGEGSPSGGRGRGRGGCGRGRGRGNFTMGGDYNGDMGYRRGRGRARGRGWGGNRGRGRGYAVTDANQDGRGYSEAGQTRGRGRGRRGRGGYRSDGPVQGGYRSDGPVQGVAGPGTA